LATESVPVRKIIHVDMDMFYAAVEIRDRPELRGRPLVVGGPPNSRSVVTTASYEARKFGIHSAMSCAEARKRCPACIFIPPDFEKYERVSEQIRKIFFDFTDQVETASLDEAYLDVTENKIGEKSATRVAREIKARIFAATGLTASAGVAPSMFVAKIASEICKPDGLCVVRPERVLPFIRRLEVIRIPGIGRKTEAELLKLEIRTVSDLAEKPLTLLREHFGKFGSYLFDIARGVESREVTPVWERKSFGVEETFAEDITNGEFLRRYLYRCAVRVFGLLESEKKKGRTVTLKIKYHDFQSISRRVTRDRFLASADDVFRTACELLARTEAGVRPIRLAGISLSTFSEKKTPLEPAQRRFPF
jgi:DNA polymerase-4